MVSKITHTCIYNLHFHVQLLVPFLMALHAVQGVVLRNPSTLNYHLGLHKIRQTIPTP